MTVCVCDHSHRSNFQLIAPHSRSHFSLRILPSHTHSHSQKPLIANIALISIGIPLSIIPHGKALFRRMYRRQRFSLSRTYALQLYLVDIEIVQVHYHRNCVAVVVCTLLRATDASTHNNVRHTVIITHHSHPSSPTHTHTHSNWVSNARVCVLCGVCV